MPDQSPNRIARSFWSLAHPRRVRIFHLLTQARAQERTYMQLQSTLRMCESSLIHHLREMERAGLIARRRKGVQAVYRLTADQLLADMADVRQTAAARAPSRRKEAA